MEGEIGTMSMIGTQVNKPSRNIVAPSPNATDISFKLRQKIIPEPSVDLERMNYRQTLDYANQQTINILKQEQMEHAPQILSATRRVAKVFNQEVSHIATSHLQDILYDLESFQGLKIAGNEVQYCLQQVKHIAAFYYPAGYKIKSTDEIEMFNSIENTVLNRWQLKQDIPVEDLAKALRKDISNVIISHSLFKQATSRKEESLQSNQTYHNDGDMIDEAHEYKLIDPSHFGEEDTLVSRLSLSSLANQIFNYCISFDLMPQELVQKGLFTQEQINSAVLEFKDVYRDNSVQQEYPEKVDEKLLEVQITKQRVSVKQSDLRDEALPKFQELRSRLSLPKLFSLIEELNYSEKCAILHQFGYYKSEMKYSEFIAYMDIGENTYFKDFYRAMIRLHELGHNRNYDKISVSNKTIAEMVSGLESPLTLITSNGRRIKIGSPRMRLCELITNSPELLNKLSRSQRLITQLATRVVDGKLLTSQEIATLTGHEPSSIDSFLAEAVKTIKKKEGKLVMNSGIEIRKGTPYDEILTAEVTNEQIERMPKVLRELFVYMRTPKDGVYPSLIDIEQKLGVEERYNAERRMSKLQILLSPGNKDIVFDTNLNRIGSCSAREKIIRMEILPEQLARLSEQDRHILSTLRSTHEGLYLSPMQSKQELTLLGIDQTNIYLTNLIESLNKLKFDTDGRVITQRSKRLWLIQKTIPPDLRVRLNERQQQVLTYLTTPQEGKYPSLQNLALKFQLHAPEDMIRQIYQVLKGKEQRVINSVGKVVQKNSSQFTLITSTFTEQQLSGLSSRQREVFDFMRQPADGRYPSDSVISTQFGISYVNSYFRGLITSLKENVVRAVDTDGKIIEKNTARYKLIFDEFNEKQYSQLTSRQLEIIAFMRIRINGKFPSSKDVDARFGIHNLRSFAEVAINRLDGNDKKPRFIDTTGKIVASYTSRYKLITSQVSDEQIINCLSERQQEVFHFIRTPKDNKYPSTAEVQTKFGIKQVDIFLGKIVSSLLSQHQ